MRNSRYEFDIKKLTEVFRMSPVTVRQAIGDLVRVKGDDLFETTSAMSPENVRRIAWLFKNEKFDLPDRLRPDCHKDGHTYPSVYGRMKWDEPAQTVTTGFLTPGRGRFIHPGERRTVTPHEAARLQSFPDSYEFKPAGRPSSRKLLCKVIGDAVPPLLARAVSTAGLSLLVHPSTA